MILNTFSNQFYIVFEKKGSIVISNFQESL